MESGAKGNRSRPLEHGGDDDVVPVRLHLPADVRVGNGCSALDRVINNDQRTPLGGDGALQACASHREGVFTSDVDLRKVEVNGPQLIARAGLRQTNCRKNS